MKHETKVTDFRDRAQVDAIYDQEVHDLIKEMTGAKKVIVFHNQLRDNSPTAGKDIRKPAFFAHIRPEERRAGTEGGRTCRFRWRPYAENKRRGANIETSRYETRDQIKVRIT